MRDNINFYLLTHCNYIFVQHTPAHKQLANFLPLVFLCTQAIQLRTRPGDSQFILELWNWCYWWSKSYILLLVALFCVQCPPYNFWTCGGSFHIDYIDSNGLPVNTIVIPVCGFSKYCWTAWHCGSWLDVDITGNAQTRARLFSESESHTHISLDFYDAGQSQTFWQTKSYDVVKTP